MSAAPKLDPDKVVRILRDVATPCGGCGRPHRLADIGARYGVSASMVHHIKVGKRWPDVPFAVPE